MSVAVDGEDNVYISGWTNVSLGDPSAGNNYAYLTKFDNSGSELWTRAVETDSSVTSSSVAVDGMGNAYISGSTNGSLEGTNAGDYDVFLIKFDSSGNELWTQQVGTTYEDESFALAIDGAGNVYSSGVIWSSTESRLDALLIKFAAPIAVPEPSTLLLGAIATVGLLTTRRK